MTVVDIARPAAGSADGPEQLLVASSAARGPERAVTRRSLVLRVFAIAAAVAVVVTVGGGLAARRLAETEAVRDAAVRTDGIAADVVRPALRDGLLTGREDAVARLDRAVRATVVGREIARVKVWSASGTILYSDEPRLIGARYGLDGEEQEALESGATEAEVSDLDEPENRFERGHGPLLEVYRAVRTPDGTPLLFEVYYRYNDVLVSAEHIGLGFAAVIAASLLLFLLALLPLLNGLVRTLERARQQRERLLLQALDASADERRRIAGEVHDGPVQDLVGASYRLGAAAALHRDPVLAEAESTVRGSVEGLRELLMELYPAASGEGVEAALAELVRSARSRGGIVIARVADEPVLSPEGERLLVRVARETLANAVKHGAGSPVRLEVVQQPGQVLLTVHDDGPGFDAAAMLADPPAGHYGLRLLQDAVRDSGADAALTVRSGGGTGTTWCLRLG